MGTLLHRGLLCAGALALVLIAAPGRAGVYQTVEQALKLAFPEAERFEKQSTVLTEAQKKQVEELAKAPVDSLLATVHTAWKGSERLGYAFVDVHTVRTVQQGLLVVVSPDGRVKSVRLLAFYEPPDYLLKDRFRAQFEGHVLDDDLQLKHGIEAVGGATLSSVATTRAVRRSLAFFQVLVTGAKTPTDGAGSAPPAPSAPAAALQTAPPAVGAGK